MASIILLTKTTDTWSTSRGIEATVTSLLCQRMDILYLLTFAR